MRANSSIKDHAAVSGATAKVADDEAATRPPLIDPLVAMGSDFVPGDTNWSGTMK
ncbi:MAG: hypothetical protein IPL79_07505 [Myxococcales bacterium]|nr:hypothetical protein [Myxococcales bacterium]